MQAVTPQVAASVYTITKGAISQWPAIPLRAVVGLDFATNQLCFSFTVNSWDGMREEYAYNPNTSNREIGVYDLTEVISRAAHERLIVTNMKLSVPTSVLSFELLDYAGDKIRVALNTEIRAEFNCETREAAFWQDRDTIWQHGLVPSNVPVSTMIEESAERRSLTAKMKELTRDIQITDE